MKKTFDKINAVMRRKYYINPTFQGNFIIFIIFVNLTILGPLYLFNLYWFWKFYSLGDSMDLPPNFDFDNFMNEQFFIMNVVFVGIVIVFFTALFFTGLTISHRIAGPLYRLNRHINEVVTKCKRGEDISDINFRDQDYFLELVQSYNRQIVLLKELQEKVKESKTREERRRVN